MTLRDDAIAIWTAGVDAVKSDRLVERHVCCFADRLEICGESIALSDLRRIEIVGCGKAGAGMSRGVLKALRPVADHVEISGWVNVPADCVEENGPVTLHAARPAGINEPTSAGVEGTNEILRRLQNLSPDDLAIVLISGGGSALLPAPVPEITLADKLAVTRMLAAAGATIHELNTVRSQLSLVKGGGLLQHCRAGKMIALIISDVIGDPLDIIASGPTTPTSATRRDALTVLDKFDPQGEATPPRVREYLKSAPTQTGPAATCEVSNHVIGSNLVALSAAFQEAKRRGCDVISMGSENSGDAAEHGRNVFRRLSELQTDSGSSRKTCLLAGGETTVRLAETSLPRKGGRNQEAVLAAIAANPDPAAWKDIALLSGGTDGEDGPTDAAGAFADADLVAAANTIGLRAEDFLAINDTWTFFNQLNTLLRTGPTHTNVMDLAVGIVNQVGPGREARDD